MLEVCSLIWLALVGAFRSRASLEAENTILRHQLYSSGVGRLVELQVSGEDLALRLALRSVDASRGPGRG
jgi:hypothetical protein